MRRSFSSVLLFANLLLFSGGCGQQSEEDPMEGGLDGNKGAEMDTLADPKAFLLPTPTQIPTYLYNAPSEYRPEILLDPGELSDLPYRKEKAMKLGGILVDAAYSGLNDDPARVKRYAKSVKKLSEELSITPLLEKERIQQLRELAERKAPLSKELLRFYQDVHKELKKEKEKKTGFFIVKGAFIEGLYLSLSIREDIPSSSWERIIEQQRLYWKNLQELRGILFGKKGKPKGTMASEELERALEKEDRRIAFDQVQKLRKRALY